MKGRHVRRRGGFTLIEVLVVVAIIALLVAVLLPSLQQAREKARIVRCLANMSNMPKAVYSFTAEHRGFAQLLGEQPEWQVIDPTHTRYEYQAGFFNQTGPWTKVWPVAYAKHVGNTTLRRSEQFVIPDTILSVSEQVGKLGRQEVFTCPSDDELIHNVFFPRSPSHNKELFGLVSYAANEDVFGATGVAPGGSDYTKQEGKPWKDGQVGPPDSKRLEGRMDAIIRPSEVVLFCDGGNEMNSNRRYACLLITNGSSGGPYIENFEYASGRLPHFRHSSRGGLAVMLADGSGKYIQPVQWVNSNGQSYVKRYAPRVRISPYDVGPLPANQP